METSSSARYAAGVILEEVLDEEHGSLRSLAVSRSHWPLPVT